MPEKISMTLDTATDTARAQDVYTRQITSNPVNAGLRIISPQKFSIRWKLTGLSYTGSESKVTGGIVDYKLCFNRTSKQAKLTGESREYFSRIYAQGRCARLR